MVLLALTVHNYTGIPADSARRQTDAAKMTLAVASFTKMFVFEQPFRVTKS